jgi:hypothetical protein
MIKPAEVSLEVFEAQQQLCPIDRAPRKTVDKRGVRSGDARYCVHGSRSLGIVAPPGTHRSSVALTLAVPFEPWHTFRRNEMKRFALAVHFHIELASSI